MQELSALHTTTPTHIDKAAKHVITMLHTYHELAKSLWPMAQRPTSPDPNKLHTPLTNSDDKHVKRPTRLRNTTNQQLRTPQQDKPSPPQQPSATNPTQVLATTVLQLTNTPNLEDIPSLCHKAIASIISKANRKLMESIRKNEGDLYRKSPKRYHNNLKTPAGLQPRAKNQPNLAITREPTTSRITSLSKLLST